eukprot:s1301_g15.t1
MVFRSTSQTLRDLLLGKKDKGSAKRSTTPRKDAHGSAAAMPGFRVVVPHGSRPGQVIRVQGPEGQQVDVTIPENAFGGQAMWVQIPPQADRSAASSSARPDDAVSMVQVLEMDALSARDAAQQRLLEEMQLQMALWASAEAAAAEAAAASVTVDDFDPGDAGDAAAGPRQDRQLQVAAATDEPGLSQTQATLLAAAEVGDGAQLLAALEEAKRFSVVSISLQEAAKGLQEVEEVMLTWRCLRKALLDNDRHEIEVWLEHATSLGLEVPKMVEKALEQLREQEQTSLESFENQRLLQQAVDAYLLDVGPVRTVGNLRRRRDSCVLSTLWGPASRFHARLENVLGTATAGCFPKLRLGAVEARVSGRAGPTVVCRADGGDQTSIALKGERQFTITPTAGTVMQEFAFFSQWKARPDRDVAVTFLTEDAGAPETGSGHGSSTDSLQSQKRAEKKREIDEAARKSAEANRVLLKALEEKFRDLTKEEPTEGEEKKKAAAEAAKEEESAAAEAAQERDEEDENVIEAAKDVAPETEERMAAEAAPMAEGEAAAEAALDEKEEEDEGGPAADAAHEEVRTEANLVPLGRRVPSAPAVQPPSAAEATIQVFMKLRYQVLKLRRQANLARLRQLGKLDLWLLPLPPVMQMLTPRRGRTMPQVNWRGYDDSDSRGRGFSYFLDGWRQHFWKRRGW